MKILFIATSFYSKHKFSGGMAYYLYQLLDRIKAEHEIILLIPSNYRCSIKEIKTYYYYRHDGMNNSVISWLRSFLSIIPQFFSIIGKTKLDIVSNFIPNMAMAVIFPLCKVFRIKTVMNFRGYSPFTKKYQKKLMDFCFSISNLCTDAYISNSEDFFPKYSKDLLFCKKRYLIKPKFFIPNAIDFLKWKNLDYDDEKEYDLCYVANLFSRNRVRIKGFHVLNEAALIYQKKYKTTLKILVIGEFNLELLKKMIKRFNPDFYSFTGVIKGHENMQAQFLKTSIFILVSLSEGMPNALLEALSSGLPSIATKVGSVHQIIKDGYNGFIIPPNDPISLVEKIFTLLNNRELKKKFNQNSRSYIIENFSWQKNQKTVLEIYKKILEF